MDNRTIESTLGFIDRVTSNGLTSKESELAAISTSELLQELSKINLDKEIKERIKRIKRLQRLIKLEEQTKQLEAKLLTYSNDKTF